MRNICVFCGSQSGTDARYRQTAIELGRLLAQRGHGLVYGGGHVGLMGTIADAALEAGGAVTGVIPKPMTDRELAHETVTKLYVVSSMHERKALMASLSDAFIALPGGYGTLEELFEVIAWAQLGIHRKPIGVLNVEGYFDALISFVDHTVAEGFIKSKYRGLFVTAEQPLDPPRCAAAAPTAADAALAHRRRNVGALRVPARLV